MSSGKLVGGQPFHRGGLAHLLRNPLYIGKVRHRDAVFDGEHDSLLDLALCDAVQAKLDANLAAPREAPHQAPQPTRASRTTGLSQAQPEPCLRPGQAVPLLHHPS